MKYRVGLGNGCETIVDAQNITLAEKWARAEFGRVMEPITVNEATEEEVGWVKGMGGRIHEAQ